MRCRIDVRALAIVSLLVLSTSASAQLFRAYLAGPAGNDANDCTLAHPCRLLPAALAAVADGGEIWMLDSANYNTSTVTIGKSVSILAVPGAVGSVVAANGPAIKITADNLKVALRNLVIVPLPASAATDGIQMTGYYSFLTIEDSLIANLPGNGVYVAASDTLRITNTTIRDNVSYGVSAWNGAQITIAGTKLLGNRTGGVLAYSYNGSATMIIMSDSIITGIGINDGFGIHAKSLAQGGYAHIVVTRCTISHLNVALYSEDLLNVGYALINVSGSTIESNYFGWYIAGTGARIKTLGNNHIQENTVSQGALTVASLQ